MSIYECYEIHEIIGHGATSTVRRAIRKDTQQTFAIKFYQTEFLKAKNQIDLLIRLDHPSIVNIYEVYEEDQSIILVLEFMAGGQLYERIGQKSKFTESEVKELMKIIVDSVRYCHEMNIVHRDIKPENLLLTSEGPEGILKLADFGISKIISGELLTTTCGTPVYMAPEIWEAKPYNEKVDVWSMGVVMYYMLSGAHPFTGDEQGVDLGSKIISNELSFAADIWNLVSSKALNLMQMMLEKDPIKRPSTEEVMRHIWFNQYSSPLTTDSEISEINLFPTLNKMKRRIFKQRHKKHTKRNTHLLQAQRLSKPRMHFLLYENQSDCLSTDLSFLQAESMSMQEEHDFE